MPLRLTVWLSSALLVVAGCASHQADRLTPASVPPGQPTTIEARTAAQPTPKLVQVSAVPDKPIESVAYRQDQVDPLLTALPIEAKQDPAALIGTEGDVIPAVVTPWRENRATRYRLVKAAGQYPLRRREEILLRDGDRIIVKSSQEMVADHLLVSLQAGQDPATTIAAAGCIVRRVLPGGRVALAAFPYTSHEAYTTTRTRLQGSPAVRAADQDFIVKAIGMPTDPSLGDLWGMHNVGQGGGVIDADIDAPEAWDLATGSKAVLVGIIDTGIDHDHPDLAANIWTNPGESGLDANGQDKRFNSIDDDGNGYVDDWRGWDFVNGDNDPKDDHYHGTHCAGTIGGVGNNGLGVAGVCWNVSLVGLKFLDAGGYGTTSGAVEATLYATAIGCTLTSNSWGGGGYSQALKDAIDAAGAAGHLFVAAAGNNGMNTDGSPNYPSCYDSPNIISVAATDRYDGLAYFSNYGAASVDLGAPGVDIYSTAPGGGYQYLSGTSMATPHVAGACALLKSANPSLSASQIKQALLATVDAIPSLVGKTATGGRLNLFTAAKQVSGPVLTVVSKTMVDGGNKNGILNPGEAGNLTVTISSSGSEPLTGVVGTLSLSHPSISITTGTVTYGTVATGSTSTGSGPFKIQVASSTVTPLIVDGMITFTGSVGGPWSTPVSVAVYTSATLSGTVKTKAGVAIPGAKVSWTGPSTGSVTANASGVYFASLIAGTYQVSASAPTYVASVPQTVTLPPNKSVSFVLGKPDISVSPSSLLLTSVEYLGAIGKLTVTNAGDATLSGSFATPTTWTASGLWHATNYRSVDGESWYYGQESTRNYDTGSTNSGALETTVLVPVNAPTLTFREWRQTEGSYSYDVSLVQVAPVGSSDLVSIREPVWSTVYQSLWQGDWNAVTVDLSAYAGQQVALRFYFNTGDSAANYYEGWYIDDVRIGGTSLGNWLMTTPSTFTVEPGQSTEVWVTTYGLPAGVYQSSLVATSNDPDQPQLNIPVTYTSLGSPYLRAVNPVWADNGSPAIGDGDGWFEPGETVSLWLTVRNTGSVDATNVTGLIATANPHLTILSGTLNIIDLIPPGGEVVSGPYVVRIESSHVSPADVDVVFNGYVNYANGWATSVPLHVDSRSSVSGIAKNGTGVPLADVVVQVDGADSTVTAAGGNYVLHGLVAGTHTLTASKSGFTTATTTVTVPGNATWNPVLGSRQLTLTPSTIKVRLARNKTVTKTIALKSTGSMPVTWSVYPPYYWLTVTPLTGTTASGATKNLSLVFSSTDMPYGTYEQYLPLTSDVTDGSSVAIQATLEVASANPPVANPLALTGDEDTTIPFTLKGTDADGDPLTYQMVDWPQHGTIPYSTWWGELEVPYTPHPDFNGTDTFTYRVFDGFHYSRVVTVTVTVAPVNDAPVLKPIAIVLGGAGSRTVTLQTTDVDSPSVTIDLAGQPSHGTATLVGSDLTYTTDGSWLGADAIPLTISDGTTTVAVTVPVSITSSTFTWTTQGNSPAHTGVGTGSLTNFAVPMQTWSQTFPATLHAPVVANGLIYTSAESYFDSMKLWAVPLASGGIAWEKEFPYGFSLNPPTVVGESLYLQRGNHGGDSQLFKLNATTGVTIWSSPFYAQWERYLAPCVANGKVYVNGGSYGGMYAFDDATGTQDWFVSRPQFDGWTPAFANGRLFSYVNNSFIEHSLSDGSTLWEVQLPKQWGGYTMSTTATIIGNVAVAVDYVGGTVTAIDLSTKTIRFTRTNGHIGVASAQGNSLFVLSTGGLDEINLATGALIRTYPGVSYGFNNAPHQPIILGDAVIFALGNETRCYKRGSTILQWSIPTAGHLALAGPYLAIASGQSLTTYRLPNRSPVFSGSTSYTIAEDTSVSGSVSDVDKDPLTITVTTPPATGRVTVSATSWKFQPPANGYGTFSFALQASDGQAVVTRSITVVVTPVNDAPVAAKQDLIIIGTSQAITLAATDVDNPTLTYLVTTGPTNGKLTGTIPNLNYVPNTGFTGVDSFAFTASDGALTSAPATVTIRVLTALPKPWATTDIGTIGKTGLAGYDPPLQTFFVQGSGADIWGTADGFRFVYRSLTGDGKG